MSPTPGPIDHEHEYEYEYDNGDQTLRNAEGKIEDLPVIGTIDRNRKSTRAKVTQFVPENTFYDASAPSSSEDDWMVAGFDD